MRAVVLALALLSASGASAQDRRVPVRVVDVAGGRAFLEPGESEGIVRGTRIRIGRRSYRVVATTSEHAAIDVGDDRVRTGDRGTAAVTPRAESAARLAPPTPLERHRGQWARAVLPATLQHPRFVPIGVVERQRTFDLLVSASAGAAVPFGQTRGGLGTGALGARLHAEPLRDLPLALDADAAIQAWIGPEMGSRPGSGSRPALRVRQLSASWGGGGDLYASLGRLRWAAATVGMLDGARVRSPALGGLTVGAFGGFVPDPADGRPAFDASRFGVELGFRDPASAWRPDLALVARASRYQGALDERRLEAVARLFPGPSRLGAHAELALFDADEPFASSEVELQAAGGDAAVRLGGLDLGARIDLWRPDRSRWLVDALGDPGRELRWGGTLQTSLQAGAVMLAAGGHASGIGGETRPEQVGGFARGDLHLGEARGALSVHATEGVLLSQWAARLDVGAALLAGRLDLGAHYRPALTRYEAQGSAFVEHLAGLDARFEIDPGVDVVIASDLITGGDVDVFLAQLSVSWRPDLGN